MKGSRPSASGKFWIFLLLTASLSSMGIAYGSWSDRQTIACEIFFCYTTGSPEDDLEEYDDMEITLRNDLGTPSNAMKGGGT